MPSERLSPASCTAALLSLWPTLLALLLVPAAAFAELSLPVKVTITGLDKPMLDNVSRFLEIRKAEENREKLPPARFHRLYQQAPGQIREALQPFGYYEPTITPRYETTPRAYQVTFDIAVGEPVRVEEIRIDIRGEARAPPYLDEIRAAFSLREGDIFDHQRYEKSKRALLRAAVDRGFIDVKIATAQVRVSRARKQARIAIVLDSGQRYFFGPVIFIPEVLEPAYLQRFVPFEQGAPFAGGDLIEFQNTLYDSDYFASVEVQPRRGRTRDHQIPIDVYLKPKKKHLYTAGIGYGSDTGTRGRLGWQNRRINRRGHRLKTELRLSDLQDSLSGVYTLPIRDPRSDRLEISTSWLDQSIDEREERQFRFGVSRTISRRPGWLETLFIDFQNDSFIVGDQISSTRLILPGAVFTRITADDRLFTRHGRLLSLELRGSHKNLGSDATFVQSILRAKTIHSLSPRWRLIARGEIGGTDFSQFSDLPPSLRFFAGGARSVRGFRYQSLGPRDENGNVIGGNKLLTASVQLEFNFLEKWAAALFFDTGNAMDHWRVTLRDGAGVGLRWHSPVGPVRLDVARPVDGGDEGIQWHLEIGPDL